MPLDVAVERPEARVVRDEAEDDVCVRRDNERVSPVV